MNAFRKWSGFARDFIAALREIGVSVWGLENRIKIVAEKYQTAQTAAEKQQEVPPRIAASVSFESEKINRYYADYKKHDALDWCMFVLTVLTLLAVAGYAVVAFLQHRDFLESNRINREALESVQRAFVTFKQVKFDVGDRLIAPYDRIWKCSITWENSGTTPAFLIVRYINADNEEASGPSFNDFVGTPKDRITIEGEIGPKSERTLGPVQKSESLVFGGFTFSPANQEKIAKVIRLGRFHIWGWIIYRDVFPHSPIRLTEFCSHLMGGNTEKGTGIAPDIQACSEHNCSDEHCKDYRAMMQLVPK